MDKYGRVTSGPCQRNACHALRPQPVQRLFYIPDASDHFEADHVLRPGLWRLDLEILVARLAAGMELYACVRTAHIKVYLASGVCPCMCVKFSTRHLDDWLSVSLLG